MTVASDRNKCSYVGNGAARVWPYTFLLYAASHLQVWVKRGRAESVRLERGFVLNEVARMVTYPQEGTGEPPLATGDKIILMRVVPVLQLLDLINQGEFFAEDVERNFDLLVMMIQQMSERLARAVVGPVDQDDSGVAYRALLDAVEEATRARDAALSVVDGFDRRAAEALAAAVRELDARIAEARAWAQASCECALRSGEIAREFVSVMQSYRGLYTPIGIMDGGDSATIAEITVVCGGGGDDDDDSGASGDITVITDGQASHAGTWYVIDPLVLQALNPKGIQEVSEIDDGGYIAITVSNTI